MCFYVTRALLGEKNFTLVWRRIFRMKSTVGGDSRVTDSTLNI